MLNKGWRHNKVSALCTVGVPCWRADTVQNTHQVWHVYDEKAANRQDQKHTDKRLRYRRKDTKTSTSHEKLSKPENQLTTDTSAA